MAPLCVVTSTGPEHATGAEIAWLFSAHPHAIAEKMFRAAHQDRYTLSFLVELRPFAEVW
jgi:hypothetical protein